ncbi:deleted in malignant brain tumors 1 protein-like [Astyanax mexicanus]|uniref:Deleted in malignant brain tumors 1 protein-like n=1 Tax=Astyanax mexicanus TaxID=7994 RepID=A0A8T2LB83_ASTMX|nr:deleted in malignant brain tumors 1 protein-like [Astyanax mexicanus]
MTSKATKTSRKDHAANMDPPEAARSDLNMATLIRVLDEHRQSLSAEFRLSFSNLEAKLEKLQAMSVEHGEKIASLEGNANQVDERLKSLEATCTVLQDSNTRLQAKVTDLESRSRRNNIRVIGLPESLEGPHPTAFFSEFLTEVLGQQVLSSPPEVDRAHRSLASKPRPDERPRPVIIRLHYYQQKEKIIREARAKRGSLVYRGHPIAIYEDYAPEVLDQRLKYREVLAGFYNLGFKPALLFPARLVISTKEGDLQGLSGYQIKGEMCADRIKRAECLVLASTFARPDVAGLLERTCWACLSWLTCISGISFPSCFSTQKKLDPRQVLL